MLGYPGSFVQHMQTRWQTPLHISKRIIDGFAVLPPAGSSERTHSWFNRFRKLLLSFEKTELSYATSSLFYCGKGSR